MPGKVQKLASGAPDTSGIPDELVTKVGRAVGQVALIREAYREGLTEIDNDEDREQLAERAEQAAMNVISDQGLTVNDYNRVVAAADDDDELEQRLLEAATAE